MPSPDDLLRDLRAAGLSVVEEPGWRTRGGSWATEGKPEGLMMHHTAPPNPFPIKALYRGGKIKCNVATHEDGTVYLVAYEACNYSSGQGSNTVLIDNVRPGIPPTQNARERGLVDNKGGNRHFWNYENSHPGDGSPMPAVQSEAIALSSAVVNAHFGITELNMISHAEWSRRKGDPYWDGSRRIIDQIREDTANAMGLSQDDKDWIRATIVDVLGGDRIKLPRAAGETFDRFGNQGAVNSDWHATDREGTKLFDVLSNIDKNTRP